MLLDAATNFRLELKGALLQELDHVVAAREIEHARGRLEQLHDLLVELGERLQVLAHGPRPLEPPPLAKGAHALAKVLEQLAERLQLFLHLGLPLGRQLVEASRQRLEKLEDVHHAPPCLCDVVRLVPESLHVAEDLLADLKGSTDQRDLGADGDDRLGDVEPKLRQLEPPLSAGDDRVGLLVRCVHNRRGGVAHGLHPRRAFSRRVADIWCGLGLVVAHRWRARWLDGTQRGDRRDHAVLLPRLQVERSEGVHQLLDRQICQVVEPVGLIFEGLVQAVDACEARALQPLSDADGHVTKHADGPTHWNALVTADCADPREAFKTETPVCQSFN